MSEQRISDERLAALSDYPHLTSITEQDYRDVLWDLVYCREALAATEQLWHDAEHVAIQKREDVNKLRAALAQAERERDEARSILSELDQSFPGRDSDGAPSADGAYWLGHGMALRIWYWLHPDHRTDGQVTF